MNRRGFLGCVSVAAIALTSPASAWIHGGAAHADDVIPVTSLTPGSFSANAFTGFASPASTVHASGGFNLLSPNPDNDLFVATTNYTVRDSQCSTYFGRGAICLRLNGASTSQTAIVFRYNGAVTGGDIRVGIMTGHDSTQGFEATGTIYDYYVNTDVATSAEGIAAGFTNSYSSGDLFTFGVKGFEIFLQWNGIDLIRYTEWRMMTPGQCAVWAHNGGGARDITVHYPSQTFLFSNPGAQVYDPRDFGMRTIAATTGSMSAASNQLTGVTTGTFQVGDQVIVCIGGEAGAGARGTKGVGGTWPSLNYANTTAMNADTSQASGTFAYDASSSPLAAYVWNGSAWSHSSAGGGGGVGAQSYYTEMAIPLPLIAKVTAVSGTTLTLDTNSSVATTNADIRLDCLSSFFVINQVPPVGSVFPPLTSGVTVSIPSSQGTADLAWHLSKSVVNTIGLGANLTIQGAGRTLTTFQSPKSCPPYVFNLAGIDQNGCVISDMKHIGNNGANGYGFNHGVNTFISPYSSSFSVDNPGSSNTGIVVRNVDVSDAVGAAVVLAGTGALIDNCTATMNGEQFDYMGWQFQIANSAGGAIQNCTATGAFLLKSFEFFACNGTQIINCGGTNVIFSTNSSSTWTIDCRGLTINYTTNCWVLSASGAIDEGAIQATSNAFHNGGTGTIYLGRHIQQGYIDASKNSLKFIQISEQPNVTVIGAYPGAGGCSTSLDGLLQAPDYDSGSAEYGSMGVYSDAASTVVSGIRVKGTAIGTPGHSSHFGNISLAGATSSVTNCVADVIQTGPTLSGNQTNTAYGGC